MYIQGEWYEEGISTLHKATLYIDDERYHLTFEDGDFKEGFVNEISLTPRLAKIKRELKFNDGSLFITQADDTLEGLFKENSFFKTLRAQLESHLVFAFFALLAVLIFTFAFAKWIIPYSSEKIAYALPSATTEILSTQTFSILDEYLFEPSKLSKEKQESIRKHFSLRVQELQLPLHLKLNFRLWQESNKSIANAFALPSGDIILTDKFIELCSSDDEMDSVLLHEVGHIVYKHSLTIAIERSFITVAFVLATGDASGGGDFGIGISSLLLQSEYSRTHESQADKYGFEKMLALGINPKVFADIMTKMTQSSEVKEKKIGTFDLLSYFSSHPSTQERVKIAKVYSKCFEKKTTPCIISEKNEL